MEDQTSFLHPTSPTSPTISSAPLKQRIAAYLCQKSTFKTLGLILGWYTLSTVLSLYNKFLFGHDKPSSLHFPHPLFVSSFHQLIQFFMSLGVISCISPGMKPQAGWKRVLGIFGSSCVDNTRNIVTCGGCWSCGSTSSRANFTPIATRELDVNLESQAPSIKADSRIWWREYLVKCVPTGMATGLDIGLSNASLQYITLTFYTMVKSASPLAILLFAFIFKLERPSIPLFIVIAVISTGIGLMVVGETKFDMVGFIQVSLATLCGGLRWSLTYMLLKKPHHDVKPANVAARMATPLSSPPTITPPAIIPSKPIDSDQISIESEQELDITDTIPGEALESVNPIPTPSSPIVSPAAKDRRIPVTTLNASNPIATSLLLTPIMFISIFFFSLMLEGAPTFHSPPHSDFEMFLYISLGGILAWTMVLFEYLAVQAAGVVTFSVAGVVKEMLTILVSHEVLGDDPLGFVNALGLIISIIGILAYNYIKIMGIGS